MGERLDRLREEYGDFPFVDSRNALPPDRFDDLREKAIDGYTGGGYAWVVRTPEAAPPLSDSMPEDAGPDRSHVLLILERDDEALTWSIPGGGREDDETYEAATVREVEEETGISIDLDAPFLVIRNRLDAEDERSERLHTLWVHFDARYAGGHLEVQPGELRGAAWFEGAPSTLAPVPAFRATEWWNDDEPGPEERWWDDYAVREEPLEV
ncbi:MAG: 8-oxo-dGTP diphosphatase [Halobacteriales archaeon]